MTEIVFEQSQVVRCGTCEKAFTFTIELTNAHFEKELWLEVDCHHCNAPLAMNLEPYLVANTVVFKRAKSANAGQLTLDLPDEVLATKR